MENRSTQFRSREERQRDAEICRRHEKIAMPAICAAHAVRKRPESSNHQAGRTANRGMKAQNA